MAVRADGRFPPDEELRATWPPVASRAMTTRMSLTWMVMPALLLLPPAADARAVIDAYPGPAFRHASPTTRITLAGVQAADLGAVSVVGERSGAHTGTLRPLRVLPGAVFTPDRPFAPDERVRVTTTHRVRGTGGAAAYHFRVASPVAGSWKSPLAPPLMTRVPGRPCRPHRSALHTIDGPVPPGRCLMLRGGAAPRPGRLLVSPRPPTEADHAQPALMVLSGRGRILWYQPRGGVVHDLNMQRYRGEPVLTYFLRAGGGEDRHEILDRRYRTIARVFPGNGYHANAHEFQLTSRDTAYMGMYVPVRLHGSGIKITDFVIQEIDVPTGDVLFEWHALDHVPRAASYVPRPTTGWAWDYFHGNSIEPPSPGRRTLIVSARKTSAVYGIDRTTGRVRWVLGGKRDQFRLGPARRFCAQHDARVLRGGDLSVFDNGGTQLPGDCGKHPARVLRFRLDIARKRVRLIRSVGSRTSSDDGGGLWPSAVGSARWQHDGDVLVNWGNTGRISEISPRGTVRFRLQLGFWSYRAVRAGWRGRPGGRPAVAAYRRDGTVDVWASWNGATHVRRWRVLAGPEPDRLGATGTSAAFDGLETHVRVRTRARLVAVQAIGADGQVLATSAPTSVRKAGGS